MYNTLGTSDVPTSDVPIHITVVLPRRVDELEIKDLKVCDLLDYHPFWLVQVMQSQSSWHDL